MKRFLVIALILVASNAWAAFGYYTPATVAGGQVPSTQSNFPKLTYAIDARLKTVANGGHVQNANGYDIRPYSDSSVSTALTYELVYYDGTTGTVEMWVKIPSLSNGYVTYFAYGDASLTTDGSSTATWSNNFLGVYHLKDGTTLNTNSATGSNNGVNNNGVTAAVGQIDGAAGFASASNQFISLATGMNPTAITHSAWVKATSFPAAYNAIIGRNDGSFNSILMVKSTGKLACYYSATTQISYDGTGSHTLSTGTWYYLAATYDSSSGLVGYVNAASDGTASANGALNTTVIVSRIGSDPFGSTRFWNGSIDEAHLSSVARSADWITTEYNNQVAPSTFETFGSEVALSFREYSFGG